MSYPPPQQPYGQPQGYGQYPPPGGQYGQPQPPYAPSPGHSPQPPPQGQYPPPPHPPHPQHQQQQHQQQHQYGYPPPGNYQQQGYYPPPPPPQGYPAQQPPPQPSSPYGAPPQPGPYGGAPPNPYGTPSPYAAPPTSSSTPTPAPTLTPFIPPAAPTPGYGPPVHIQWDADPDAQACRRAMKGLGTDEGTLIRTLSRRDCFQVLSVAEAYRRLHGGRDLVADIKKETRGWLEYGLVQLARGPLQNDVRMLHEAMAGPGTDEAVLNDVLLGRSNADLMAVRQAYQAAYKVDLVEHLKKELSGKVERHFLMVMQAARAEEAAPVVPAQVDADVLELHKATEAKLGTDELIVCSIFSSRSDNQLRAISATYFQKYQKKLDVVIKKEFSGDMEDALLYQLRHAEDRYMHEAQLLEASMKGMGTHDRLLTSRVVRYHWDRSEMANVKAAYQMAFKRPLAERIKGETKGDYERMLLACIGES